MNNKTACAKKKKKTGKNTGRQVLQMKITYPPPKLIKVIYQFNQ